MEGGGSINPFSGGSGGPEEIGPRGRVEKEKEEKIVKKKEGKEGEISEIGEKALEENGSKTKEKVHLVRSSIGTREEAPGELQDLMDEVDAMELKEDVFSKEDISSDNNAPTWKSGEEPIGSRERRGAMQEDMPPIDYFDHRNERRGAEEGPVPEMYATRPRGGITIERDVLAASLLSHHPLIEPLTHPNLQSEQIESAVNALVQLIQEDSEENKNLENVVQFLSLLPSTEGGANQIALLLIKKLKPETTAKLIKALWEEKLKNASDIRFVRDDSFASLLFNRFMVSELAKTGFIKSFKKLFQTESKDFRTDINKKMEGQPTPLSEKQQAQFKKMCEKGFNELSQQLKNAPPYIKDLMRDLGQSFKQKLGEQEGRVAITSALFLRGINSIFVGLRTDPELSVNSQNNALLFSLIVQQSANFNPFDEDHKLAFTNDLLQKVQPARDSIVDDLTKK